MTNLTTSQAYQVHPSISDLAEDLAKAGYQAPVTEYDLREHCALPSWCAVPPLVVEMVNQVMGCEPSLPTDRSSGPSGDLMTDLITGLDHIFSK